MREAWLPIVAVFLLYSSVHCQENWIWQNPSPQGNGLYGVHCFSYDKAIMVGQCATVLRTTDGGMGWDRQNSVCGLDVTLYSVCFTDENNGFAVGGDGTILKTADGGMSWAIKYSKKSYSLMAVYFLDSLVGWAGGSIGYMLKTTDGGETWTQVRTDATEIIYSIFFVDENHGWAVGGKGLAIHSTDGGVTWVDKSIATVQSLKSVWFLDNSTGFIVGPNRRIYKTANGGNYWAESNDFPGNGESVCFTDGKTGWVAGWNGNGEGLIYKTSDSGGTWVPSDVTTDNLLYSIDFSDPNTLWAVGSYGQTYNEEVARNIFKSCDGGRTWQVTALGRVNTLERIQFVNDQTGWAGGVYGLLLHTTDGGTVWQRPPNCPGMSRYSCLFFIDENTGWLIGPEGFHLAIFKTVDGGSSWIDQSLPVQFSPTGAFFLNEQEGWICGGGPSDDILKTEDGGITWHYQATGNSNTYLSDIFFVDPDVGWTVGGSGRFLKTTDGGADWIVQPSLPSNSLESVWFVNENVGWTVGLQGKIFKTTDGGANWVTQKSGTASTLKSLFFVDENTGWVAGYGGTILGTTNGGEEWIKSRSRTTNDLISITFSDATTGWVAGVAGTILKTVTGGGITEVDSRVFRHSPSTFALRQNYPNPFNPSTTIRFVVKSSGPVSLKVYDVLGRRVASLVNGKKGPGAYTAVFDGGGLTSGVYFYELKAGNYLAVKKMLLVK